MKYIENMYNTYGYEHKYTKRDSTTHKSVSDFCPGLYHTTSQYLYNDDDDYFILDETF